MSTPTPTTLITGSNGAIGFPVVLHALHANHKVLAVVRTETKANQILSSRSVQSLDPTVRSRLSTVIIPDLLPPNAYDEVLSTHKVDYIIHVASPIPTFSGNVKTAEEYERDMVRPSVEATLSILEAAEKAGVKRVVVTSSVVAMMSIAEFGSAGNEKVYDEKSRTEDSKGPFNDESSAYRASKIMALNAAEKWLANGGKGRRTEVVHIHPAFVLGGVELARTKEEVLSGSSGTALKMALSTKPFPRPLTSCTCWLEDVAEVHVRAVDGTRVPNGQSLVVSSDGVDGITWTDAKGYLERAFPNAVEKGALPNGGWAETVLLKFDAAATEKLVGMKFEGYERQIVDIAGQYLDVIGEERK